MEPISFRTAADGAGVLHAFTQALVAQGYTVSPAPDGWGGRAEVGSSGARFLAGGFSRRMIVDYRLLPTDNPAEFWLTITSAMSGWSGGIMGVNQAKKELKAIHAHVGWSLQEAGLLR